MKIEKNSRQIPSIKKYTADKRYNDLLYGILQERSYAEMNDEGKLVRYVDRNNINYQEIGEMLHKSRQTASARLKSLEKDLGLIEYDGAKKRYKLNYLENSISTLIPFETLRIINNSLNHRAISLYVYFLNRYIANGEKEYIVTMSQMKNFLGMTTQTSNNNHIVKDIINVLGRIGLIKFYSVYNEETYKSNLYISEVKNKVVLKEC